MNEWLSFFGIWYAEGWASNGCVGFSVSAQIVKDLLYPVLENLGYTYSVDEENKLTVYDYQLYRYMKPLCNGLSNTELPQWVFELSKEQTRILIRGMHLGDDSDEFIVYTQCVKFAEQIQQLCLHAGWVGIIIKRDILSISIRVTTTRLNSIVNQEDVSEQEEKFVEKEKCPVFCLQVPSEVFYVRRNGKACWTGNSRSQGHVTTLTRQPLVSIYFYLFIFVLFNLYLFFIIGRKSKRWWIKIWRNGKRLYDKSWYF